MTPKKAIGKGVLIEKIKRNLRIKCDILTKEQIL